MSAEKLAIDGGPKVREAPFPPWPALGDEDIAAVAEVLRSGRLTQLTGGDVAAFEEAFAAWNGSRHCVATGSGTSAIHTVLAALGIGPGDEVIVPAHTFIASATPVLHQRATPVFADIDERTYCISPESVAERITPRTKAIIAVHLNGHPADMDRLLELAERRGTAVVEDAAQAHGALYKGRKVGTIGLAGCFSFWEDKIMTTGGEGGCVVTEDDALAERMRRIRHHGEGPVKGERAYYHLELGYNYRMTSMQAATGLVQLRRLDEYLAARRRHAAYLSERLGDPSAPPASEQAALRTGLDAIEPPFVAEYAVHSYYKYICRLVGASGPSTSPGRTGVDTGSGPSTSSGRTGVDIGRFVQAVAAEGVPISRRYPTPLPQQPVFREAGLAGERCPVAERLAGELFTLLVHPTLTTADLDDVVAAIRKVAAGMSSADRKRISE